MPEITVSGEGVYFQDTLRSAQHTIVFLHGPGGSHRTWRDQWAGLKGGARLVIPDLPGHGGSGGPARKSIEEYAAWLREFVAELELKRYVLAGHSMGGAIAQQAAIDGHPGIEALILTCTGAKLRVHPAIIDGIANRFRGFAPELVEMMMAKEPDIFLRDDVTSDVLSTRAVTFLSDFAACDAFDIRERLAGIHVPALIIAGDQDRLTPLKYGEYLAARIRGGVLKIIPGTGHLAMLERPVEVNNVITSFLQSLG
ncbi:MAG TPA: alpha/beta hydrolase [Candidatus Deferrimicrobiaceae bacterium]|nr:alpha/beta hydrolase [Candidatus Deferrimicrobiaceae bacterium]